MALSVIKPSNPSNPPEFKLYIGKIYEVSLNQSIQKLLDSFKDGTVNFSEFIDKFYELMQVRLDPPLETLWYYVALIFHGINSSKDDFLGRISLVRDLFQLISACSGSSGAGKSVSLLAPVVFKVYGLVVELWEKGLSSKREKKMMRDIRALVDVVLGYTSVCYCRDSSVDDVQSRLIRPLEDLVCIWMSKSEVGDGLKGFFPLVNDEIRRWISGEGCDVGELAGVVIAEVLLLRICLCFHDGASRLELEKELKSWVVGSITGFRNIYLFEILVRMLLEPTLPMTSLLGSTDEAVIRKVLYDALIAVEYNFLSPEQVARLPIDRIRHLTLARLVMTNEAVEKARKEGDQSKAISYINSFSASHLPSQIIKLAVSSVGLESAPVGSSPKAFIKWLLNLEEQGLRIFHESILDFRQRLTLNALESEQEEPVSGINGKNFDPDNLFYIDNKGEENGDMDGNTVNTVSSKKRKGKKLNRENRIKFRKFDLPDDSDPPKESFPGIRNGDSGRGSDVEKPSSDEDMVVNEQ